MRLLTAMILVMLPVAAAGQEPAGQRQTLRITGNSGLSAEDRGSYCLWAGQLYSIGASFCTRQQTLSTCSAISGRPPIWVIKENDKFCDKNLSQTPQ